MMMSRKARSIAGTVFDTATGMFTKSIKRQQASLALLMKKRRTQTSSAFLTANYRQIVLPSITADGNQCVSFSTTSDETRTSPFAVSNASTSSSTKRPQRRRRKLKFVPRNAAVALTPRARTFFRALLESTAADPNIVGIMLKYHQSSSGEPRMVFSFDFAKTNQLSEVEEGVSLEVLEDGVTPKPPDESEDDGLPKLYVHHNAFMKVLGCTLDVDEDNMVPLLYDRDGNKMDPNA